MQSKCCASTAARPAVPTAVFYIAVADEGDDALALISSSSTTRGSDPPFDEVADAAEGVGQGRRG